MKSNRKPISQPDPAFTMSADDRFFAIVASNQIRYDQAPDTETVLVFFAIRRSSGLIDIFNVLKTFKEAQCISRNVQSKLGIPESKIATELEAIKTHFTDGIRQATHFTIAWDSLDLSQIQDRDEQVRRIQAWNRLNVYKFPDFSLN